ncbi:hypothetical protein Airi02_000360 [Actinoallomurus iriomotensis]|uniref:Uncharacterized protein n=1 Tax=Actinoallomurus iriomotensis TaxID=478107 RepID=A0A9W6VWD0_9ACTN|nr:hypothetical protein Airi02_000360 [Actinoallomurus iriomotensis]
MGAGSLLILAAGIGTAEAKPTGKAFEEQAKAAHLTNAQTAAIRSQVSYYLKKLGGKQTALNQIDFNGGRMLIAIPGEAHPRNFASGSGKVMPSSSPCAPVGTFCAFQYPAYKGHIITMVACQTRDIPWNGSGSWINNQTPGTRARMYNARVQLIYTTPGAYSSDVSGNWTPVTTVSNC